MKLAYLVNQYPKTSHSFIRREINGLEQHGCEVLRFAIRAVDEPLVHPLDQQELELTTTLLDRGALRIAADVSIVAALHPLRFVRALGTALRFGWRSQRGLAVHLVYLAEACSLLRALSGRGVEHLHAHFAGNTTTVAALCHRLGGPGFSFTAHGTACFDDTAGLAVRRKLAQARFAVAVCEWGAARLRAEAGPDEREKVHVVGCGPEPAWIDAPELPIPNEPRLLCVSRLSSEKGPGVLIEALALLDRAGVPFELDWIGDGPERAGMEQALRSRGLEARVHLLGWRAGEEVRASMLRARAIVLSSLGEGLPVVLLEALALRRPVVCTAVGGIAEIVATGADGWLVPPADPPALAAALRAALAAAPEELLELGREGARRVAERHDPRREAARLLGLLRRPGRPQSP